MYKVIFFLLLSIFLHGYTVAQYQVVKGCYSYKDSNYEALRVFKKENIYYFLVVNSSTLETKILDIKDLKGVKCSDSRYFHLLDYSTMPPYPLENDGIVSTNKGVVITTDLCPSSKSGFEDRLYLALIDNFKNPVSLTLFITKRWINRHIQEFKQLKSWQKEGKLDITWGNHTAYHHYHPKAQLLHNFVLSPEENLTQDILDNEIELISRGITPSIFFRFPGLISDKKSVDTVKKLGLIVVGTNCWLAKGDKLNQNSIILLHGNKNEPKGVDIFLKLLKDRKIEKPKDIKSSL